MMKLELEMSNKRCLNQYTHICLPSTTTLSCQIHPRSVWSRL